MTSNSRHGLPPRLMANQPTRFTAAQESKPSPSPGIRMTSEVRDNPEGGRFELDIGGQTVFARYARHGSLLVIPYVEAPPPLRGTGAASQLMRRDRHGITRPQNMDARQAPRRFPLVRGGSVCLNSSVRCDKWSPAGF